MSASILPVASPMRDRAVAARLGRRRKAVDIAVRWFCIAATAVGLFFLASILLTLAWRGSARWT
jgi:phosphate transport system permease protein